MKHTVGSVKCSIWACVAWALLAGAGCRSKEPVFVVERLEVSPGASGMSSDAVRHAAMNALAAAKRFVPPGTEKRAAGAVPIRLTVELGEVRWVGPDALELEAGLTARPSSDTLRRYDFIEIPKVSVEKVAAAPERVAAARALDQALPALLEAAATQLVALQKPDSALLKDLSAERPSVRDAALRVLVERKHPAAFDPLVKLLQSPNPEVVRTAVGRLVELGDRRAAGPLIEAGKVQRGELLQEVIFALAALGGPEAEAYLFTVGQGHDDPAIRQAAERALEELNARQRRSENRDKENR